MDILAVHNYYQAAGGEDEVFKAETSVLRRLGHHVVEYVEDNARIDHMSGLRTASSAVWSRNTHRKLREILDKRRPDIAHFHNTFVLVSPSAYYACHAAGVPVVQTLHNYRLLCPVATLYRDGHVCEECLGRRVAWPGVRWACYHASSLQTAVIASMLAFHRLLKTWRERVDVYVALTQFARKKFIEGGLPAEKIVVKPNFVFPDPGVREGTGEYVLFVGRLSPEKGLRTLLRAWHGLKTNIALKIVGDGALAGELQASLRELGERTVKLLGQRPRNQTLELMKRASLLVFPSEWYEGFPMVIAEAFACGVPVITARLGAMQEIVEDGRTGIHFTPGDAEDLAAKVEQAWSHPGRLGEMGRAAREEYELKYTAEESYKILMDVYHRASHTA